MSRLFISRPRLARMLASATRPAALLAIALGSYACSSSGPVRLDGMDAEAGEGADLAEVVAPPVQAAYDRALEAMIDEDLVEAELQLEQLTLEHPSFAGPFVNLAILYARDGRNEEAESAVKGALAIDPGHAAANNQLGMLLRRQGRFADAEAAYSRALQAEPGYALAHLNLAILLDLYLHRPAEALSHYRAYQDSLAEPDSTVALWIIDLQRRLDAREREARIAQGESP